MSQLTNTNTNKTCLAMRTPYMAEEDVRSAAARRSRRADRPALRTRGAPPSGAVSIRLSALALGVVESGSLHAAYGSALVRKKVLPE